mmetsp:Transcript_110962/g.347203  ORF Transcript_110962/g.347203 Transcript_110962/m.347203 type:complete len:226 (+) Transcript_110962:363-1040(+)
MSWPILLALRPRTAELRQPRQRCGQRLREEPDAGARRTVAQEQPLEARTHGTKPQHAHPLHRLGHSVMHDLRVPRARAVAHPGLNHGTGSHRRGGTAEHVEAQVEAGPEEGEVHRGWRHGRTHARPSRSQACREDARVELPHRGVRVLRCQCRGIAQRRQGSYDGRPANGPRGKQRRVGPGRTAQQRTYLKSSKSRPCGCHSRKWLHAVWHEGIRKNHRENRAGP